MLPKAASLPEARQDSMVDRHIDYALHSNRAKVDQKLTFRNTEVYGDASKVQ